MDIELIIQDAGGTATTVPATLNDSRAAGDFAALLPLTLSMQDLFRREKYAGLPRPLDHDNDRSFAFTPGLIVYWSPGPDVAIFYREDSRAIPDPGVIVLGWTDADLSLLDSPATALVTVERAP